MVSLFQFHKGSIKTAVPFSAGDDVFYFNSIKVRLRPGAIRAKRSADMWISIP